MRDSKLFLEENNGRWEETTKGEKKSLEKEERQTRLEMMERKKRKFGKAGNCKLTSKEEENLRQETCKKRELAEIRQNIRRRHRYANKTTTASPTSRRVHEGRKKELFPTVTDWISSKSRNKMEKISKLECHWKGIEESLRYIEEREAWISTRGLERSDKMREMQMDGKGREELAGKAWNFWQKRSPVLPRSGRDKANYRDAQPTKWKKI